VTRIHKSAWLWALTSGVLQVLVFPKPGLYFLCWIAIAPLIYAILRAREADASQLLAERDTFSYLVAARVRDGFLLGWVSGIVTYAGTCYWVYNVMNLYGGLHPVLAAVLLVLFAMFIGLHHAVFGALLAAAAKARTGFSRRALVLAPFLWVSVELLRTYIVSFPWNLLGTAQVDNIPLARLASVTGVYGISFEIALVNSAFAASFLIRPRRRKNLLVAAVTSAIALQAAQFVEVHPAPADRHALLVQQNIAITDRWTPEYFYNTIRELSAASSVARKLNASVIIWPESPAPFFINDDRFVSAVARLAREQKAHVIAGSLGVREAAKGTEPENVFNSAVLLGPDGSVQSRYDKVHLVPWGEYIPYSSIFSFAKALTAEVGNFEPGTARIPLALGDENAGVFICYESVFPGEVRQFADRGAQVFVNISNDGWFGESGAPEQHLDMVRMRAIENGRWVLRATNTGITASIDPMGRVVAVAPRNERTVLDAPYMLLGDTTVYTRNGDWFPISCAIISIAGLLWRGRRTGPGMAEPQPV